MAGLGLSDAVDGYFAVKRDQERSAMLKDDLAFQAEQRGRMRQQWGEEDRRRQIEEEARAAGRAVFENAQRQQAGPGLGAVDNYMQRGGTDGSLPDQSAIDAAPRPMGLAAAGGAPAQPAAFKPTPKLVMDAYDAAAGVYLKNGDYEGFTKKFAESAAARTAYRNSALDDTLKQYRLDRDLGKLAKTAYSTINDGVDITDVVSVKGVRQLGNDGRVDPAQSVPATLSFKLSDGTTTPPMTEQEVLQQIQFARMNPEKVLELEYKHSLTQAEIEARRIAAEREAKAKGIEDRLTEETRTKGRLTLADVEQKFKAGESEKERATRLRERQIAAGATLGAANISAGASRYSADKSLEGAKLRAKAEGAGGVGKRLTTKERLSMVEDSFGQVTEGGFGSKRIGSATTAKIVEGMEAYLKQNPDATESEAMNAAARVMGIKPEPITR